MKKMIVMNSYFELEEFLHSDTAIIKNIENLPSFKVIEHIKDLLPILNALREGWGSGIKISSGFRNDKLNDAVGGVKTSAHTVGWAVDLVPSNGKIDEFIDYCKKFFEQHHPYDQVIIEKDRRSKWIHFGWKNIYGKQRNEIFNIIK